MSTPFAQAIDGITSKDLATTIAVLREIVPPVEIRDAGSLADEAVRLRLAERVGVNSLITQLEGELRRKQGG